MADVKVKFAYDVGRGSNREVVQAVDIEGQADATVTLSGASQEVAVPTGALFCAICGDAGFYFEVGDAGAVTAAAATSLYCPADTWLTFPVREGQEVGFIEKV